MGQHGVDLAAVGGEVGAGLVDRIRAARGALQQLDHACTTLSAGAWLLGPRLTQPDITAAAAFTFLCETLALPVADYPALAAQVARCEAMPVFAETHLPFFTPSAA